MYHMNREKCQKVAFGGLRESASPQGAKGCFLASSLSSVRLERTTKFEAWAKCLSCQVSPTMPPVGVSPQTQGQKATTMV